MNLTLKTSLAVENTVSASLPSAGQTALWKYRGFYNWGGERVGLWSDIVSTAVTG